MGRMYERDIFNSQPKPSADAGSASGEGLQPISWDELSARIGAAHDFRRLLGAFALPQGGSFNQTSARHLAQLGDSEQPVNHFALSNGKSSDAISPFMNSDTRSGDRGRE